MTEKKQEKNSVETKETNKTNNQNGSGISSILGDILFMLMNSPFHKHLFLADLEWLIMPAVKLKQMRVFRNEQMPLAYISWGYLSEEVENRILMQGPKLAPSEWKSGDNLWIIDRVSHPSVGEGFLKVLANDIFKDKKVNMLVPKKDGQGFEKVLVIDYLVKVEEAMKKAKEQKEAQKKSDKQ